MLHPYLAGSQRHRVTHAPADLNCAARKALALASINQYQGIARSDANNFSGKAISYNPTRFAAVHA
jgi:hypothetical protein